MSGVREKNRAHRRDYGSADFDTGVFDWHAPGDTSVEEYGEYDLTAE